jgi:hypothetical protein
MFKFLAMFLALPLVSAAHENCQEGSDGFFHCEQPHARLLSYRGQLIEAGKYGEKKGYLEALECIQESISSGELMGKKWNSTFMRSSFVKVPKDIAITDISLTPEYRTYSVTLGDHEFAYAISLTSDGSCQIENDEYMDV